MAVQISKQKDLHEIPGTTGLPIIGDFIPFIRDTINLFRGKQAQFGDVYITSTLLGTSVILCGPTHNKTILIQESKNTSNQQAWDLALGELFPNGLMLMDGERHQTHRSIILDAFKPPAMQGYLDVLPSIITRELDQLPSDQTLKLFPFFKGFTLKIASQIFFGLNPEEDLTRVNQAISDIVAAATAVPVKLPFTTYGKGVKGRAFLLDYFKTHLPERRKNPGKDLFSRLCLAKNEEGEQLSDQEILDHLIFILMAAHDTTAATMTWMSYLLATHQSWQEKVRAEAGLINFQEPLNLNILRSFDKTGLVLKEVLRLHPPLILIPRVLQKELVIEGHTIPRGTVVNVMQQLTHMDERVWTEPEVFDPERFNSERKEQNRCPFAYMPFGAGPHHCIGYAFAEMVVKLIMPQFLTRFELSVPEGYLPSIQDVPIKQPKDGMPVYLKSL